MHESQLPLGDRDGTDNDRGGRSRVRFRRVHRVRWRQGFQRARHARDGDEREDDDEQDDTQEDTHEANEDLGSSDLGSSDLGSSSAPAAEDDSCRTKDVGASDAKDVGASDVGGARGKTEAEEASRDLGACAADARQAAAVANRMAQLTMLWTRTVEQVCPPSDVAHRAANGCRRVSHFREAPYLSALSCPYSGFTRALYELGPLGDHLSSKSRTVNAFFLTAM